MPDKPEVILVTIEQSRGWYNDSCKKLYPYDVVSGAKNPLRQGFQVNPFIGRFLGATVIEIQAIDVDYCFHLNKP